MNVHVSVLEKEVIQALDLKPDDIVIDGTINGGGHASLIANELSKEGTLIGIDQDQTALEHSQLRLKDYPAKIHLVHDNTRNIQSIVENLNIPTFNKMLLDLGWSSNQFENAERGFSFMHEGPLLMTFSGKQEGVAFTACDIINEWEESSLIDIIQGYGEERYAKSIVRGILEARDKEPITSTKQLADIITHNVPSRYRHGHLHPATRTFQALRITVNDEMGALRDILEYSFPLLASGGRMAIISFHSIEDRIVKNFFKQKKEAGLAEILTKKPITAGPEELHANNRARSAKLRILHKL